MSLLSHRRFDRTNRTLDDLFNELLAAYDNVDSARQIANAVGMAPGTFPVASPNMQLTWEDILAALVKQGKLRKLVEKASEDRNVEGHHAFFRKVLQQDDEERAREEAGNAITETGSEAVSGKVSVDEYTLNEENWKSLLRNIEKGRCAPFLGPGIYSGDLPSKAEIAEEWSSEHGYPWRDNRDITHVAQYLSMQEEPMFPRRKIVEKLNQKKITDLNQMGRIFEVLAKLPLPVYLTTNYDNLIFQALEKYTYKEPVQEFCRWNDNLRKILSTQKLDPDFRPTPKRPLVFNFFGCMEFEQEERPESLVITEDEYFRYLVNISKNPNLIPPRVQEALANSSLLFLGYSLSDIEFRVLLQLAGDYLKDSLTTTHVCIQLDPGQDISDPQKVRRFLGKYFGHHKLLVYWGTYQDFIDKLETKWDEYERERKHHTN